MTVLAVTWMANPGQEAEVAKLFKTLEAESRKEDGCLMYIVHRHKTDTRRFFIYEQYDDDAALEEHRNSEHFQRYAVRELANLATRLEGELYKPLTYA
jgi:(4S)-4-hydroxy-5-phosphonooxypentane-2,3-dione isomerase